MFKILKVLAIAAAASTMAACASTGQSVSGPVVRSGDGGGSRATVDDPAPIVSGTMRPYQVRGQWYRPEAQPDYDEVGLASWYGDAFNGRPTSSGEAFDMHGLSAAHKTLPLPGLVEVTNLENGRRVVLRLNDRGPFVADRIIDLSRGAAEALDMIDQGVGRVRVRYLGAAPRLGGGRMMLADAQPPSRSPPPSVAPPALASARSEVFWIQAAAFPHQPEAEGAAGRLGARARVQAATDNSMYRVLLGPWPDANAAEQARQTVMARGYAGALLISAE